MLADFDGDSRDDLTVYRPSTGKWLSTDALSSQTGADIQWGLPGDTPAGHDYDGDGRTDAAIFRPSDGGWYLKYSSTGAFIYLQWGLSSDSPLALRAPDREP